MIKIPENINYCEIYLTLRCPLMCPYCINNYSGVKRNLKEWTGEKWVEQINKIDFKDLPLTIGGGEPTYHPNFYFIINNLREDIKIDLLTNLQFDIKKFIKNISIHKFNKTINPAYKSIRVSFHPAFMKAKSLINKVKILQDEGYSIGVFGISHPMNLEANVHMAEESRKAGVYFFIKDFLGTYKKHKFGFYQYPEAMEVNLKKHFVEHMKF